MAEDRALIVFALGTYQASVDTVYGQQPYAVVDGLVVTGRDAGRRERAWTVWGNLDRQLGTQAPGASIVARVVSGAGRTPGSTWYGLDFNISDADLEAARNALSNPTATQQSQQQPAQESRQRPAYQQQPQQRYAEPPF